MAKYLVEVTEDRRVVMDITYSVEADDEEDARQNFRLGDVVQEIERKDYCEDAYVNSVIKEM